MKSKKPKVVVGLSGGVDSAVALLLLKKQGFEPMAVSLRFSGWSGADNLYSNQESFKTAEGVCRKLKVPYRIVDCRREFKEKVIGYFLKELRQKRTPNPCVVCNYRVKFKNLLDFAEKNKIEYVATGHYARIKKVCHCGDEAILNERQLLKGKDKEKDQSYFLCLLTQKELKHIIFPLGDLTKKEVCRIAGKNGLDFVLIRKPSQDVCFVGKKSLPLFLEKEIGLEPGEIIDARGNVLGEHKGLHFYTIGQRRGLDIARGPWRVVGLNKEKNQLIVTDQEKDNGLYSRSAVVFPYYFVSGKALKQAIEVRVKCRYNQPAVSAILSLCHFSSRPARSCSPIGSGTSFSRINFAGIQQNPCHSRISLCHSRASGNPDLFLCHSRASGNPDLFLCHSRISLCYSCVPLCHSRASGNPDSLILDSRIKSENDTREGGNDTKGRRKNMVVRIRFRRPQKAVAPGQWAVFYQGNVCLGGGIIQSASNG